MGGAGREVWLKGTGLGISWSLYSATLSSLLYRTGILFEGVVSTLSLATCQSGAAYIVAREEEGGSGWKSSSGKHIGLPAFLPSGNCACQVLRFS
jgi:hypothetical protein